MRGWRGVRKGKGEREGQGKRKRRKGKGGGRREVRGERGGKETKRVHEHGQMLSCMKHNNRRIVMM